MFDGNATTESSGPTNRATLLEQEINAPTIFVTFDGEEYTLERTEIASGTLYGDAGDSGPSFANIPFAILSMHGFTFLYTESAGTYPVKIEADGQNVETTPEFEAAVESVIGGYTVNLSVDVSSEANVITFDKTAEEVFAAMQRRSVVCIWSDHGVTHIYNIHSALCDNADGLYRFVVDASGDIPLAGIHGLINFSCESGEDYPTHSYNK